MRLIFGRSKDNSACLIIIFGIFILSFFILSFFYLSIFSRFAFSSAHQRISASANHPVSVIICAKNEMENLNKFLPSVLEQDYPLFEVIVVNDRSTDGSQQWLENLAKQTPKLRVIKNTAGNLSGKRNALKRGIETAQHEIILLTDADCLPASRNWIRLMTSALNDGTEIVLGYSPCLPQKGMFHQFIRYENFLTALHYLSFAQAGMPYMGTGRNLLFRTSVAGIIGALEHPSGLMTGDDDITVNRIATSRNTALMIHPQSHVFTIAAATPGGFIHQKRRHYLAGFHYRPEHRMMLGALYASQILFNATVIPLFTSGFLPMAVITVFTVKNILQMLIYGSAMRRLNVHNLWIFTPVFDLCASAFFLTLGSLSFFKINTWK